MRVGRFFDGSGYSRSHFAISPRTFVPSDILKIGGNVCSSATIQSSVPLRTSGHGMALGQYTGQSGPRDFFIFFDVFFGSFFKPKKKKKALKGARKKMLHARVLRATDEHGSRLIGSRFALSITAPSVPRVPVGIVRAAAAAASRILPACARCLLLKRTSVLVLFSWAVLCQNPTKRKKGETAETVKMAPRLVVALHRNDVRYVHLPARFVRACVLRVEPQLHDTHRKRRRCAREFLFHRRHQQVDTLSGRHCYS